MFRAGVARTRISPFRGVELTGWGYFIERGWREVHDHLNATALAFDDGRNAAIIVALDLMVIDGAFTQRTRTRIAEETGLPTAAVLLTCSHSHNAPAAGGLRGAGASDPAYEDWAGRQAATAAVLAWERRVEATIRVGSTMVPGLSFNRTRPNGVTDDRLTVARVDRADGSPLAIVANFAAHPTVATELRPWHVGRDVPGVVVDGLEGAFPDATALYLQGACGDVNFLREFSTEKRWREPGERLVEAAIEVIDSAPVAQGPMVACASATAHLPTRRWSLDELMTDREEAERRLRDRDISNWRETIGRAMTNRPDDMVKRHGGDEWKAVAAMCRFHREWTEIMLRDYKSRPETLATEVQVVRVGDLFVAANSSEFFSPFALQLREETALPGLMIAAYSNGRIGYLPDARDIADRTYAAYQSPKYCDQFPFTAESGPAMVAAMKDVIAACFSGRLGPDSTHGDTRQCSTSH